ncbi:MAG: tyrosine-type recombinase/integrase [Nitrososphaerota archaeon]|nr:tyrosine-type recombinase/integrase [Nitrososphaerota archaeon]
MDIHNYQERVESGYRKLERAKINEQNRNDIREFARLIESMGLSKGRVAKLIFTTIKFAEKIDISFKEMTKKDVEDLMIWLNNENYTPITKNDMKKIFKRFTKWVKTGSLERDVPFPHEVSWVHTEIKSNEQRQIDVLTDDEIKLMIAIASSIRDKAFVAVLAEGGFRIGEILPARIKDVAFDERGAIIHVTGKTGPRIVRLITSGPMLSRWIEEHPRASAPDSFLWPSLSPNRKNIDEPLTYQRVQLILKRIARSAGIQKRVYPHLFRHSAATRDSSYLSDRELILKYGWAGDSSMPATYVHMNPSMLDDKLLSVYSGQKIEPQKPKFAPIICPRCGFQNTPGTRFCGRCSTPLNPMEIAESSVELEEVKRDIQEILRRLDKRDK